MNTKSIQRPERNLVTKYWTHEYKGKQVNRRKSSTYLHMLTWHGLCFDMEMACFGLCLGNIESDFLYICSKQ